MTHRARDAALAALAVVPAVTATAPNSGKADFTNYGALGDGLTAAWTHGGPAGSARPGGTRGRAGAR